MCCFGCLDVRAKTTVIVHCLANQQCRVVQVLATVAAFVSDPVDVASSAVTCRRTRAVVRHAPLRLRLPPQAAGGAGAHALLRGLARSFKGVLAHEASF